MEEFRDFEEFIKLLNEFKVEYLIVGGYAVTFHSRPRFTEDLDIWVNNSIRNSKKLFNALNKFGFGNLSINENDFTKKDLVLQLGYRPVRIDILTSIEGVKFREAYRKRKSGLFYNKVNADYINLKDLVKNKLSTNRDKDKEAVSWIKNSKL